MNEPIIVEDLSGAPPSNDMVDRFFTMAIAMLIVRDELWLTDVGVAMKLEFWLRARVLGIRIAAPPSRPRLPS